MIFFSPRLPRLHKRKYARQERETVRRDARSSAISRLAVMLPGIYPGIYTNNITIINFYRTQVSRGSGLWVPVSVQELCETLLM